MLIATLVLLSLSIPLFLLGLLPCFGPLNWVGVPLAATTAIVGLLGLALDRAPGESRPLATLVYLAGLLGGVLIAVLGGLRCAVGYGVF